MKTAETSGVGDTHTVSETVTAVMCGTEAAIHTYGATNDMAGAVVEAVANFANPTPGGVGVMIEAVVVKVAAKYGGIAVILSA
jgi:hypothetical protein